MACGQEPRSTGRAKAHPGGVSVEVVVVVGEGVGVGEGVVPGIDDAP